MFFMSQSDRSGCICAPPNVGPPGPRGKVGGGNESGDGGDGLKGGDCDGSGLRNRNQIRIGRADVTTNGEVIRQGGEEKVRGGGDGEGYESKGLIQ